MHNIMLGLAAAALALPVPAQANGNPTGKTWRDSRGQLRCQRPDGTTGLVTSAARGALVGRVIDSENSRATGTILAAAAGALVGRSLDRSRHRCR